MSFKIKTLKWGEIYELYNFAPDDWNFDLPEFMQQHFDLACFFAYVAKINNQIVATGNGIFTGNAGWVGNIVVDEKYRRQGIATAITQKIVAEFMRLDCLSILLIATNSGMPVYYKLGFKTSTNYSFYQCPLISEINNHRYIRKIETDDYVQIFTLDKLATGENRLSLLANYVSNGFVYAKNDVQGYYLPGFGAGFIVATTAEAGLSLLKFKLTKPGQIVVIPEENFAATSFLEQIGCIETTIAPRMFLGEETNWHPEMIFSRAAGWCG